MKAHNAETQATVTPRKALEFLKLGNERFVKNLSLDRNLIQQVNETRDGQWPFAIILSCIDSRTPVELLFDQGLGDVFSARIAGNIVNRDIVGSMEYACKVAKSKLIVVMGHSKCGAVTSACQGVRLGNISYLLSRITPCVDKVLAGKAEPKEWTYEEIENVSRENVKTSLHSILWKSHILKDLYERGEIGLASAYYDVESGKVEFIEELFATPE